MVSRSHTCRRSQPKSVLKFLACGEAKLTPMNEERRYPIIFILTLYCFHTEEVGAGPWLYSQFKMPSVQMLYNINNLVCVYFLASSCKRCLRWLHYHDHFQDELDQFLTKPFSWAGSHVVPITESLLLHLHNIAVYVGLYVLLTKKTIHLKFLYVCLCR